MITIDQLNEWLEYKDGALYWKMKPRKATMIGDRAGTEMKSGRRQIKVLGKRYLEYRIIFFMHHGYFPEMVDHIDGDVTNNRIENLRAATKISNQQNAKLSSRNTSGVKNVSWNVHSKKWQVVICINKKQKNFGEYDDIDFAELVAIEARNKYHGGFARHA